jgi:dTDP-4-dehydrorhamnose reductase
MRLLITGASGYVGRHLIDALSASASPSYQIHAAVGSDKTFAAEFGSQCEAIMNIDLGDASAVSELVRAAQPDAIVHLAAISAPAACEANHAECARVNEPACLLDAMDTHAPAARLIAFSSDQVYEGLATETRPYTEADEPRPVNQYGRSKLHFERATAARLGGRHIALRCSLVIGPRARGKCKKQSFLQFVSDAIITRRESVSVFTNEWRSAVDVADVVAAVGLLLSRGWAESEAGVYNLGGPARYSRADLAMAIAAALPTDSAVPLVVPTVRDTTKFLVLSPPDISMDSGRLVALTGLQRTSLPETVRRMLKEDGLVTG